MIKKIIIVLILCILFLIGIITFYKSNEKKDNNEANNIVENEVELSSKYVEDDCLKEWEDYRLAVQEEIYEASQNLSDEDKVYKVKSEDNYIKVYYINKENEEVLYKVTDISIKYLENDDIDKLKEGIYVTGIQKLNQILEDFE